MANTSWFAPHQPQRDATDTDYNPISYATNCKLLQDITRDGTSRFLDSAAKLFNVYTRREWDARTAQGSRLLEQLPSKPAVLHLWLRSWWDNKVNLA